MRLEPQTAARLIARRGLRRHRRRTDARNEVIDRRLVGPVERATHRIASHADAKWKKRAMDEAVSGAVAQHPHNAAGRGDQTNKQSQAKNYAADDGEAR